MEIRTDILEVQTTNAADGTGEIDWKAELHGGGHP